MILGCSLRGPELCSSRVSCSTGDFNPGKSQPLRYASEAIYLFNNVYNGPRTTQAPKITSEKNKILSAPPPTPTAPGGRTRRGTSTATSARVVLAKVTVRPVEVAGRLSSGGGAHLGRSGRVGGCAGKGTHARRAKVMCGRGIGQG